MNGSLAGIALLTAVIGVMVHVIAVHMWPGKDEKSKKRRNAAERGAAVVFFAAAGAGVLAAAPSLGALWQVTSTGQGLVILLSLLLISGVLSVLMVWRGHHHHRTGTTAVAVMFGLTLGLVSGGWHQVTRSAGKSFGDAGAGIASAVVHGHAVSAVHGAHPAPVLTSGTNLYVLAGAGIVFAGLAVTFFVTRPARMNARRAKRNERNSGGGRQRGGRGVPAVDMAGDF